MKIPALSAAADAASELSPRAVRRFPAMRISMSLRARLRIFVVVLMISVVSALTALNLYSLAADKSQEVKQRLDNTSQQVYSLLDSRIRDLAARNAAKFRKGQDYERFYTDLIRGDPEVMRVLSDTIANTKLIVEILVAGTNGEILADSVPARIGAQTYKLPNINEWVEKSPWKKLMDMFSHRQDYEKVLSVGIQNRTLFNIKFVSSSVDVRELMIPQLRSITLIFLCALFLSTLLAIAVSNLALRPLTHISLALDRISKGEYPAKAPPIGDGAAKEFAAVQSKLQLLGQQFRGAKEDVMQLRSNVEQMLERLEEVVLLFDRDDRLVMAGRAAERLLGRGRWEMMGRSLHELFPADSALGVVVQSAIELRQPLRDHPIALDRDGGAPGRLLVNVEVLEGFPRHERIGTLITLRDAETRRQIQSQLDISTRLAAISRLTGGVAHEIKNPLQAMRVHLEVLRSKLSGEGITESPEIDTIDREIMRLDRVVKTFLDFTRPVDLQMQDVDMAHLVRDVGALVTPSADKQQVVTEIGAEPEEIWVHGDRDLLQQAILNVVMNGVEAMKAGGRLRLQARETGGECIVTISDEGGGIPAEIRDKIFNLYFSTKGKGSGIGLAMTFRVVQLHNGTIDFTSEPGVGTTFRLRFPAIGPKPLAGPGVAAGELRG